MNKQITEYLANNKCYLPPGTNLLDIEKMFCNLNNTQVSFDKNIVFEDFKEKYIYKYDAVPTSGWNDPNELWYYLWKDYVDEAKNIKPE